MDDIFMFGEVTLSKAKAWKTLFDNYANLSSQYINFLKKKLIFFNTQQDIQRIISIELEFQIQNLLDMYLNLPFSTKKPNHYYWNSIIEKIQKMLAR